MRAIAELQRPSLRCRPRLHVGDHLDHLVHRVGPHQIDVRRLRRHIARHGGETTEIEGRTFARKRRHPWRIELESVEIALEADMLAVEHGFQYLHRFHRALVTRPALHHFAGDVGRDDVDVQSPAGARRIGPQDAVQCRNATRQLRRPILADAHRHQQLDPLHHRRNRGGEHRGVHPQRIARRQQYIVEPALLGRQHDVAAMLPARLQHRIGLPQKLVIIVAQRRKPADFALLGHCRTPLSSHLSPSRLREGLGWACPNSSAPSG